MNIASLERAPAPVLNDESKEALDAPGDPGYTLKEYRGF